MKPSPVWWILDGRSRLVHWDIAGILRRQPGRSSDNIDMACFTCGSNSLRSISAAMAKAASARLRSIGAGRVAVDWAKRAAICEGCAMRVVRRGVSYCGTPFLQQMDRDPLTDGCGSPTREKAKSPGEHCPVNRRYELPVIEHGNCSCKWCAAAKHPLSAQARPEIAG